MSKKKILLIVIAVVFGAAVLFLGPMMYKFSSETKKMKPLATGEIVPGVYAVLDDYVNFYIVKTGKGYIVFDAGNDEKTVESGLRSLGIPASDVRAVFLTHTDGDHTAGVGLFPGAVIYIAGDEEQMINGAADRFPCMGNKLDKEHKNLKDGQVVSIDDIAVTGILTPGHTRGSMCYLVNGEDLFTGDTLSLIDGRAGLFNDFFNMDSAVEKTSITRIAGLSGVKRIFTAHYGYSPDFAAAFSGWDK